MSNYACILLAAGQSQRFGSNKMLHVLANGKSVIENTAEKYRAVFDQITVIVRTDEIVMHPLLGQPGVTIIAAHNAEQGLSQSLITGLQAYPDSAGWLIALADMPYVKAQTIREIEESMSADKIVAPYCQSRQGNPVGLGRNFLSELERLTGDRGAKSLIEKHSDQLVRINTDDEGVLHDIDRPEDCL